MALNILVVMLCILLAPFALVGAILLFIFIVKIGFLALCVLAGVWVYLIFLSLILGVITNEKTQTEG